MYAYNPRRKSFQQLENSMVGDDRWDILNSILEEMDIKKEEGPKQHWIIIGPRGIGKSHLMTLLYHKVKEHRKLSKKWISILFPEELRMIRNLSKFLERALNEIIQELDKGENSVSGELKDKIAKINQVPIPERAEHFFSLISWFHQETGKHVLLITENLQQLLGKKLPVIEQKKLRAFLQISDALLIIGSATTVFDALHDHSHPFYHFFHIRRLGELSFKDMKILIGNILSKRQQVELKNQAIDRNGRLNALYTFTGGNPRMAVFLADILSTEVPDEMLDLMDRILDELTPYFESIINGIPDCFEGIINTLASFKPAQSPGEIAGHLEIPQTTVRSYLKKLKEDGYVKVAFSKGKSNFYCLNEYLYRVWYQMRDGSHREETRWLMELLLMVYSSEAIIEEKGRLDACADAKQLKFAYKKLIDQTAKFVDSNPDYCKVIEWCIDSTLSEGREMSVELQNNDKILKEIFTYLENRQFSKAIEICKDTINNNPESEIGYLAWGVCLAEQGLNEEAIVKFQTVINLNSKSVGGYSGWGKCLSEQGRYKEATETFQKVIELNPEIAFAHWSLGDCLREGGFYEKAIESFKEAAKIDPQHYAAYGAWGDCLRQLGLYKESEKQYKKALDINKYYEDAYFAWGYSLVKQNLYKEAMEKCKELIKLNPKSEEVYCFWGFILGEQGLCEEAIKKYKQAIEINPNSDSSYLEWGEYLRGEKRYEEAIDKFKKALDINNNLEPAYRLWGGCLRVQGRFEEAIERFKHAIALNPNSEESYLEWGECLQGDGQYEEAIDKFKKALDINKNLDRAYGAWGACLSELGRNEEALSLIETNIHDSRDCVTIHSYAYSLIQTKRYKDALNELEKLIEINPECPGFYHFYSRFLEMEKNKEEVLIVYLKHLKSCPNIFAEDFNLQEKINRDIIPLINNLEPRKCIEQFYEPEKSKLSKLRLTILLVLLAQNEVVCEHIQDIFEEHLEKGNKGKEELDLLVFSIIFSIWLKLFEGSLHDGLKLVELYIGYIKALKTIKEKENVVLSFSLALFRIQIKLNIEAESVREILKRMEEEDGVPFSDVIFKIWMCLSEPDSVEAQKFLNEKAIAEIVSELNRKVNVAKKKKNDIDCSC